ncbi:carboxypeptidase-like regulatory domain-containing protein [Methanolacinia paynteri]|uniref:carboxypeptidase-like regulatory domain-containing protein n=1 Tax=Methanolacinia paynteri TaxID=230356 RepID=UPI00064F953D|nr:carboxypeptidase-like regulatory domain-containing protein [Methanolacinia paynteri]
MKLREKPLIIIIIITALVVSGNAYTPDEPAGCSEGSYWYNVNPVGAQPFGANFTISGTTNLPAGQEIGYMIQVSDLGPGSPGLRPPSYTGSTTVVAGEEGINSWSAEIDTTKFETDTGLQSGAVAGKYSLIIGPFCNQVFHFVLTDDRPISIAITWPENGSRFHSDVVPHEVRVIADISSKYAIANVTLDSGWETVESDPSSHIEDSVHVEGGGENSISVTVTDEKGNTASETTMFTIITGPPPAPIYTLHGLVTDPDGEPVEGCLVSANSSALISKGVFIGSTAMTDANGSYRIEYVYGPKLNITAEKEGFRQYKSLEGFDDAKVEFDIVMTPEEKESPGFGFIAGIAGIAFAVCLLILMPARRRAVKTR